MVCLTVYYGLLLSSQIACRQVFVIWILAVFHIEDRHPLLQNSTPNNSRFSDGRVTTYIAIFSMYSFTQSYYVFKKVQYIIFIRKSLFAWSLRDHSNITYVLAPDWVGGFRNWPFLLTESRWMDGLENPQKHASVILKWSLT